MSRVNESFSRARRETPPPGTMADIERNVMQRISGEQTDRRSLLIRPLPAIATAAALLASLLIVIFHTPQNRHLSEPQFVESVFVLEDHICIWLEPMDNAPGGK